MRSKCATFGPAVPSGVPSARGTYLRIALIDHARAGHAFVGLVAVRAAADHLGDLLVRVGGGEPLRHDRAHAGRRLGQRVGQQRERILQAEHDGPVVGRADLVGGGQQRLAEAVARAPALDRGDAVARQHLGVVVEHQVGRSVMRQVLPSSSLTAPSAICGCALNWLSRPNSVSNTRKPWSRVW